MRDEKDKKIDKVEVRRFILDQKEPFCITDILERFSIYKNIEDRGLILDELDDLYDEGLIGYEEIKRGDTSYSIWAFVVK